MPNMAIQFGALIEPENGPTKPPAEETAAGLRDPDIRISSCSDTVETEPTTVTAVSPRRRRSLWSRTKRFVHLMFCCRSIDIAHD